MPPQEYGLPEGIPIPWADLRKWIDSAVGMQDMMGGATIHIPRNQLLAISCMANFVVEPKFSKEDHVSMLLRMFVRTRARDNVSG